LKHGQNAFASTAKHVLRGLDGSKPQIENVAPMSQIVEIASKLPDPEVAATKQVQDVAPEPHARPPKPQVKETKAKLTVMSMEYTHDKSGALALLNPWPAHLCASINADQAPRTNRFRTVE
jgi:hypothetical protein